jgi:excisionase family DNA binding protein
MDKQDGLRLIPLRDAAERLGLALGTLRRWSASRRIATVKIGGKVMILNRDLDALIARCRRPARSEVAV